MLRERTPMCGSPASHDLEYLTAMGGIRPKLSGLRSFQCLPLPGSHGYQPPLFDHKEEEAAIPSVQANLRRCQGVCRGSVRGAADGQPSSHTTEAPSVDQGPPHVPRLLGQACHGVGPVSTGRRPPHRIVERVPSYTVWRILDVHQRGRG